MSPLRHHGDGHRKRNVWGRAAFEHLAEERKEARKNHPIVTVRPLVSTSDYVNAVCGAEKRREA